MEIERDLRSELSAQINYLKGIEAGTDEYKARVESITKLLDRLIEMEKLASEHEDRVEATKREHELKLKELEEARKGRWARDGMTAGLAIGEMVFSAIWIYRLFRFEETGTITARASNGLLPRIFYRRK